MAKIINRHGKIRAKMIKTPAAKIIKTQFKEAVLLLYFFRKILQVLYTYIAQF